MNEAAQIITAVLSGMAIADGSVWKMPQLPESDWQHDDERVRKAEEKRQRKQAKRIAMREGE